MRDKIRQVQREIKKGNITQRLWAALKENANPHAIATGFTIGTLIGILPTPGIGILSGIIISLLFKKINRLSIFVGMAIWNPITMIPVWYYSYRIGAFMLGQPAAALALDASLWTRIVRFSQTYMIGNLIICAFAAPITYFLVWAIVSAYQKKKLDKLIARLEKNKSIRPGRN